MPDREENPPTPAAGTAPGPAAPAPAGASSTAATASPPPGLAVRCADSFRQLTARAAAPAHPANRILLLCLLLVVLGQNFFLISFARQLRQMRSELLRVQEQVAQIRVWRASVGIGFGSSGSSATTTPLQPAEGAQALPGPLARLLAGIVLLQHEPTVALDRRQRTYLQRRVDAWKRRYRKLEPLSSRLAATWAHADRWLSVRQRKYLRDHRLEMDQKAGALASSSVVCTDATLVPLLSTLVRADGGKRPPAGTAGKRRRNP